MTLYICPLLEIRLLFLHINPHGVRGGGAVGVQSTKFYIERLCPEVQPLTLLYTIFWQKRYALHIPSINK